MESEIASLLQQQIGERSNFPIQDVLFFLQNISQEEQWEVVRQEVERAVDIIRLGVPVLFFLVDNTKAGGLHSVKALYNPNERHVALEIPEEGEQKGGRFPSVLHAVEIITAVAQLSNPNDGVIEYPDIEFMPDGLSDVLQESLLPYETVLIPLTVDPDKSNVIIFHTQARGVDPKKLVEGYYEAMKNDLSLYGDLIRHTMLVHPKYVEDQPPTKQHIIVDVLPNQIVRNNFRLMHPGRIATWDWNNEVPERELTILDRLRF